MSRFSKCRPSGTACTRSFFSFLLIACVLVIAACSRHEAASPADGSGPVDISDQFFLARSEWQKHEPMDVLQGRSGLHFERISPPLNINVYGTDNWLKTRLQPGEYPQDARILEIPGHLLSYVDIWFEMADGTVIHDYSGTRYPYVERKVKNTGVAFMLPEAASGPVDILVRIRSKAAMPINFAALLWSDTQWERYIHDQRAWYGIFIGAIMVLALYNLFLAFTLRDKSYLFYVAYILTYSFGVVLLSGLGEEYLWPGGKVATFIPMVTGVGVFFTISFVNNFLQVRQRNASVFRASTTASIAVVVYGFMTLLGSDLPLIPPGFSSALMHLFLLLGFFYIIGISVFSYYQGLKQARFLVLSMLALLVSTAVYMAYTYAIIKYNVYVIHMFELGSLAEGVLLSFALADQINLLSQEKEQAEKQALDSQRFFSKRLLQAQEKDREMFSNTMHDSIGHGMLVLKQNLETISDSLAPDKPNPGGECSKALRDQVQYCGEILADVRRMSHDLHPHLLKRLGLKAAIESTMERAFSGCGIEWQIDIGDLPPDISAEREITIYRVIQECINNILKHANATEVMLSLNIENDIIRVNIKDDGDGFDIASKQSDGLGLHEMEERIKLFGGCFKLDSVCGEGTHTSFGVPCETGS